MDRARIRRALRADLAQKRRAKAVIGKHAVQIAAHHPTIGRNRALWRAVDKGKGARAIRAIGAADVNLIARHRQTACGMNGLGAGQPLVGRHLGLHRQMPQTCGLARGPLKPQGVAHKAAKHLIAAANADKLTAVCEASINLFGKAAFF